MCSRVFDRNRRKQSVVGYISGLKLGLLKKRCDSSRLEDERKPELLIDKYSSWQMVQGHRRCMDGIGLREHIVRQFLVISDT